MRVKVLYIAGWGRSGTTILDSVLAQLHGFCSVGELRWLWDRGLTDGWPCGCGAKVADCDFWKRAVDLAFGDAPPDLGALADIRATRLRTRDVPQVRHQVERGLEDGSPLGDYGRALGRVYGAVANVTGARVLVDSSKYPADAVLLSGLTEVDLYVAHVVRDPRAVAYSWSRRKASPGRPVDPHMRRRGPLDSSVRWLSWNMTTATAVRSRLGARYALVRYEDFVADPATTVRGLLTLIDEPDRELALGSGRTAELAPTHGVSGNPSRFITGAVTIRPDDEWRADMTGRARRLASLPALPLLHRYGYLDSHLSHLPSIGGT